MHRAITYFLLQILIFIFINHFFTAFASLLVYMQTIIWLFGIHFVIFCLNTASVLTRIDQGMKGNLANQYLGKMYWVNGSSLAETNSSCIEIIILVLVLCWLVPNIDAHTLPWKQQDIWMPSIYHYKVYFTARTVVGFFFKANPINNRDIIHNLSEN